MRKWLSIVLVLLLLGSLSACGEEKPGENGSHLDWVWVRDLGNRGALSDTGYYHINNSVLSYADLAAGASVVLCDKAGCSHKAETCSADIVLSPLRPMYFLDGRLYYFEAGESILWSRNATGADLKEIGTVCQQYIEEEKAVSIGNCAAAGGYLYYEANIFAKATTEDGASITKLERECIGRIDLSTGKDEILIEQIQNKQSQKLVLCAVQENGVLLNRWEGTDMDRKDPAYVETVRTVPATLEYWNGETGETTVLFRKTLGECSGIKMVSGGKAYYKAFSDSDAENAGYLYSYDLRTGKEETACPYHCNYLLGGAYVQCQDAEGSLFIYDMSSGKKLPYELEEKSPWNVSENGIVIGLPGDGERLIHFVPQEALADGLQESDLNFLYTMQMASS